MKFAAAVLLGVANATEINVTLPPLWNYKNFHKMAYGLMDPERYAISEADGTSWSDCGGSLNMDL